MNIKITHNWLLEYLETDASPSEIQEYLSLCGPSVEKIGKVGHDYIYDIEIISNRVDMASVFGIAQEAAAILPQFAKKAKIKENPLKRYKFSAMAIVETRHASSLQINVKNPNLCSRFTAVVLENVKIKPSPDFISKRLQMCGIKSINNVIDISNYLMLALGQPVHVFDYDRIGKATMIMRESKKGEKIITLDGKQIALPGNDTVIEDGDGKLIDLCGIMGGFNSAVTPKTNKVVLFVQTYNPQKIRRTSTLTGQRTVAAIYFEKGLDEEKVESTTAYGIELLQKYANAKISSQLYDIYPHSYKIKKITVSLPDIQRMIGVAISRNEVSKILARLGFSNQYDNGRHVLVTAIPSWRTKDISIKEDLIEEIARIYGYHNLPNNIQPTVYLKQPKEVELLFELQTKIKHFLKNLGLNEVMNYSMMSKKVIENAELKASEHLLIKNSISEEIQYMRKYLVPSLIKNIKDNEGKRENLKFFEIAKSYKPRKADLPIEKYQLAIATNTSLADLKGIVESLFKELNITEYKIEQSEYNILEKNIQGQITIGRDWLGKFGQLKRSVKEAFKLKSEVFLASFEFEMIMKHYKPLSAYKPINPFAVIKLDQTFENCTYEAVRRLAYKSKLVQKIELASQFKNKFTIRFYFSAYDRNITEDEAKRELTKIKNMLS